MINDFPERKTLRHKHFDYNEGIIFITACTLERKCLLSQVVGTDVLGDPYIKLTEKGKIVDKYICQLNDFYNDVSVTEYVIMPNHVHLLLFVRETDRRGRRSLQNDDLSPIEQRNVKDTQHSKISKFISTLKRFSNQEIGENIWQRGSYDHIIRSNKDLDNHIDYIRQNPQNWYYDELYAE